MIRALTISAVALFSIMLVVGETVAQERSVLQEGFSGIGTGKIGSGPGGGIDNASMRELLSKPETVYGRLWGKDIPGGKIYVETGGGSLVTLRIGPKTNIENVRQSTRATMLRFRPSGTIGDSAPGPSLQMFPRVMRMS